MAEVKLKPVEISVSEYLKSLPAERQADCKKLNTLMKKVTGKTPKIWYGGMVGYGKYNYTYPSGHSGESFPMGFSSRKAALTLYMMGGFPQHKEELKKLGKFKTGKGCLYIKNLSDVDEKVLEKILNKGWKEMAAIKKKNDW